MNIKRFLTVGILGFLFLGISSLTWAQPMTGKGGTPWMKGDAGKKHQDFIQELNLTPEQQEQLRTHRQENKAKMQALRQQMQAKRQELKGELRNLNASQEKIYSLVAEIKGLYGQLLDLRVEGILFTKSVLSPEQFAKFEEKAKNRREHWQENRPEKGRWKGKKGMQEEDDVGF